MWRREKKRSEQPPRWLKKNEKLRSKLRVILINLVHHVESVQGMLVCTEDILCAHAPALLETAECLPPWILRLRRFCFLTKSVGLHLVFELLVQEWLPPWILMLRRFCFLTKSVWLAPYFWAVGGVCKAARSGVTNKAWWLGIIPGSFLDLVDWNIGDYNDLVCVLLTSAAGCRVAQSGNTRKP